MTSRPASEHAEGAARPDDVRRHDLARLIDESLNEIYVFEQESLRFVEVNRAARANLGYSMDELTVRTPLDIKPAFTEGGFRQLLAPLQSGLRDKVMFETEHRRKDGTFYPVEVHLQLGSYGGRPVCTAISLDITKREQAKARQLDLVRVIDDSLNEVYVVDRESLRFLYVNQSARRNLGYSMRELAERTPLDLKPELTPHAFRALLAPIEAGEREKIEIETVLLRKDGTTYEVEVHLQPSRFSGRASLTAIILDITERKRAERERRAFDQQMQQAQKMESLGVLAGGIAHDFNNILASVVGYADLVRRWVPAEPQVTGYLDQVVEGAQRAAELTQQLLAYSGQGKFVVQPLDLADVVRDMGRLLEVSISKKCVLRYEFTTGLPAVEVDPVQLRQVVMNLIINASEAIGDRSGVISVSTGVAHCSAADLAEAHVDDDLSEGMFVYLDVVDTGEGMSEETRQRIFDPFFTTKFTGRGLGLAALLGIVRGHRGAIQVRSELGRGSTFRVLLPVCERVTVSDRAAPSFVVDWRGSGAVLVVDDEETVRSLARLMLEELGFEVLTAADGREGVAVFREHAERIRLVLLDMTMPHLDGPSASREMHRIRPAVPTLLTSGYSEQAAAEQIDASDSIGFLQKPYRVDQLVAAVRTILDERPDQA